MVRERDETNPRGEQLEAALEEPDPVESLTAVTRVLVAWWREINPIAQALYGAALTDDAARAAWEDRMTHLHELAEQGVRRLDAAGFLALPAGISRSAREPAQPARLDAVSEAGWSQRVYEERMTRGRAGRARGNGRCAVKETSARGRTGR